MRSIVVTADRNLVHEIGNSVCIPCFIDAVSVLENTREILIVTKYILILGNVALPFLW